MELTTMFAITGILFLSIGFFKENGICIIIAVILFFVGGLYADKSPQKEIFKPLYEVDPKEKVYIIYNKQLKQFDTIQHGELENYIMLDNL